ncbi:DUF3800 domain-containing protein [Microbulbifer sp. HZ11]|uniref:DUF3800 domain-containing protein n=1 Tax=Microbulbifer sp. HZ11 TaxID=1453501 RepID=UPI0005B8A818|nr:DUF3800 domain-containing protein [Microbulbifer sp. HZ11]
MANELVIYCDESVIDGKFYSNFYGGVLIKSTDLEIVAHSIAEKMKELNLNGEVKWQKVTANYLEKYRELMCHFFDLIKEGLVKVRIMFTQNCNEARHLSKQQRENEYYLLYYQFLKHAFGLPHFAPTAPTRVRINFDRLPENNEQSERFKAYIAALSATTDFRAGKVKITPEDIYEVESHDHPILQCMDVILGSMAFRLNDKHREKPPGQHRRGKRTVAKEQLYKYINARIRDLYPGFNIGVSTGMQGDSANKWHHPYRHWNFVSNGSVYNPERVKGKK